MWVKIPTLFAKHDNLFAMINYQARQSPKAMLRTLTIIYLALLAGQIMFGAVVLSLSKTLTFNINSAADPLIYVVPIVAAGCFIASNFMFQKQMAYAQNRTNLPEKLTIYQTALIIRCAFLQGASLFGIVATFLGGNLFFLSISALLVLQFIIIRPTKDKLATDLNLGYDEKTALDA